MGVFTNQPMYIKVKNDILRQIRSGSLKSGDKLPTEFQLADTYAVSRITITNALNELKKEGLLVSYPRRGTFVANSRIISSSLSEGPTPAETEDSFTSLTEIACLIPSLSDLFSLSLVNGVLSVFSDNSYICHIFQSRNTKTENYLLRRCAEAGISGIILFPQDQHSLSTGLSALQSDNYPLVLIDRCLPALDVSYVIPDHTAAGELCVQHLHELGHQRIAFVTTAKKETLSVSQRIHGIRQESKKLEMPEHAVHIVEQLDCGQPLAYYQELFLNLILKDRVTAFIASESGGCAYLYDLFTSLHLKVPGDISLISFDKPISNTRNPDFFTHINQSEYTMGREAGILLLRILKQKDTAVYHKTILPQLEICQSTGPSIL